MSAAAEELGVLCPFCRTPAALRFIRVDGTNDLCNESYDGRCSGCQAEITAGVTAVPQGLSGREVLRQSTELLNRINSPKKGAPS